MNKSKKYVLSEFTMVQYKKLLIEARKKYEFLFFNEVLEFSGDRNFALWRHDVDYSIENALHISKLESELDIKSTYFINLHNEVYNILEKEVFDKIKQIKEYGHQIALHFDSQFYEISSKKVLGSRLKFEQYLIEEILDIHINVFSFHNPTKQILEYDNWSYAGLINTYAKYFKEELAYCSDSNGYWRFKSIQETIDQNPNKSIQVLTHPVWWDSEVLTPREKVHKAIDNKAEETKIGYDKLLKDNGRENIDWKYVIDENANRKADYAKKKDNELFQINLNRQLQKYEQNNYQNFDTDLPFIFVFGLPRSGTTILTQILSHCLDVSYINNFAARFWHAPMVGMQLSRILLGSSKFSSFTSDFGKTGELTEPHEFGYFWQYWLKKNEIEDYLDIGDSENKIDWEGLKLTLANIQNGENKAMVFRNIFGANYINQLNKTLKKVVWVYIEREPMDVAISILNARRKYYGDRNIWWATFPPNYKELKDLAYPEQIAGQVVSLEKFYQEQIQKSNQDNVLRISYKSLCNNPNEILSSVIAKVKDLYTFEIPIYSSPPKKLEFNSYVNKYDQYPSLINAFKNLEL